MPNGVAGGIEEVEGAVAEIVESGELADFEVVAVGVEG